MRKAYFGSSLVLFLFCTNFIFAGDGHIRHNGRPIAGDYIVKLSSSVSAADVQRFATTFANSEHGRIKFVYDTILPGFAISGITEAAAKKISASPLVDLVEEDAAVTAASVPVQNPAPWHLDRLDQRTLPLDGAYYQDCSLSRDAVIYVVDSGVRATHQEFWTSSADHTSRVLSGADFSTDYGTPTDPCNNYLACDNACLNGGHGTAVASVAAGRQYGVAKTAKIIPVRVVNCHGQGYLSQLIAGLNWIYNNPSSMHGVVNISLATSAGDPDAGSLELAIDNLVNVGGVSVVVAAGNGDVDVQNVTPARHSHASGGTAITVGGSNNQDHRWECNPLNSWEICDSNTVGSNWGTGIDIFAPAQNISSASLKDSSGAYSDTAERQQARSGTSFASPIVAGLAARYIETTGLVNPSPAQVWTYILAVASGNSPSTPPTVMSDGSDANSGPLNGSPNRLIYAPPSALCN